MAYASAQLVAQTDRNAADYNGPPVLAVEILSPSDKHEETVRKVQAYLETGVIVWELDPYFRTVRVHRPGKPPEMVMVNEGEELLGDPELPGFRVPVAGLFGS